METFPLKREIIFCECEHTQPRYLRPDSKIMDISTAVVETSLGSKKKMRPEATVKVANVEAMLASSGLDPSQQACSWTLLNTICSVDQKDYRSTGNFYF